MLRLNSLPPSVSAAANRLFGLKLTGSKSGGRPKFGEKFPFFEKSSPQLSRDFDLRGMDEMRISSGQVWVAVLHGHETRMLVIATGGEIPDTWICEKLSAEYNAGTGPHVMVRKGDFVRLERQVK